VAKRKKSLGRDAFEDEKEAVSSSSLKNLIKGSGIRAAAEAKEVEVRVRLTPSNLKHLDNLIAELEKKGKGTFSRSRLIRVAITLLRSTDF